MAIYKLSSWLILTVRSFMNKYPQANFLTGLRINEEYEKKVPTSDPYYWKHLSELRASQNCINLL
jgi:hypothetical protein